MSRKSLDDILDGNVEPETEVVEAQPEQPQEPEAQPRDESGRFAGKGEEPEAPVDVEPPSTDKAEAGLLAAKRAETQARQAAEKRAEEFAAQLEALRKEIEQQRPKEPAAPAPDIWSDTEGWQQNFGGQLVNTAVQQAAYQSRLQMSEMLMAEQHENFAEIKQQLVEFVGKNPAINKAVAESQHPWRTAYNAYVNQQTLTELGATDLNTLKAKLREELLAELQAGVPAQPKVPTSLSTKRSVGTRTGPAWTGPTPLGDLIGG